MSTPKESFATNNCNSSTWPHPKPPTIISSQLSKNTDTGLHHPRFEPDECGCNSQNYESDLSRYKKLASQEHQLRIDIMKINNEMSELLSRMLNSTCKSEEETIKSIYQVEREQSGGSIIQCASLIAPIDPPIESPIKPVINCCDFKESYRNPNNFQCCAIKTPHIEPAEQVDFTRVPEADVSWNKPFMGRSEYMDTIGKLGMSNLKNQKQCFEPISPSRSRWANRNL